MSAPCPRFGFIVTLAPPSAAIAEDLRVFADDNGLVAEIASAGQVIVAAEGTQTTDGDRSLVRAWAERYTGRVTVEVSEIVDLR